LVQARLGKSGLARQIQDACTSIRIQLRTRGQRGRQASDTPGVARKQWVEKWLGQPIEQWDEREKRRVVANWTERWTKEQRRQDRVIHPGTDPGNSGVIPVDAAPNRQVLKMHSRLQKAESAVLVQARTGCIGLARFLYSRKVPGVQSAKCRCGAGDETPRHMALYCIEEAERRQSLRTNGRVDYQQLVETASGARKLAEWIIRSGRLGQFSLARILLYN
jgi:hypothetical protein